MILRIVDQMKGRNIGIQYAFKEQYPIVLFNEAGYS